MNPKPQSMHIKRLHLRVAAENAEAGRAFAHRFADELAARSDGLSPVHVGALHLKVRPTSDAGAAHAAQTVIARLNRGGPHHA